MPADPRFVRWLVAALLVALPALACGPDFPDRFLLGRRRLLRDAPRTDFAREVAAIAPAPATQRADDPDEQAATRAADLEDLRAQPGGERLVQAYDRARTAMRTKSGDVTLPAGLPREIQLYASGARAFHAGNVDEARAKFAELLALPERARRSKSTWAAFMFGKLSSGDDAVARFREVRRLASAGFDDRLHLAASSLSEEARVELDREHHAAAVDLYAAAHAAGDATAASSLRVVAGGVLRAAPDARARALRHPRTLELVASWLSSARTDATEDGSRGVQKKLGVVVDALPSEGAVRGAERLAWVAYRVGDARLARRLLGRAPPDTLLGDWLAAKLALRAGRREDALRALGRAVAKLEPAPPSDADVRESPLDPASRARGELAVLRLRRGELDTALSLLLASGSWRDAAHVAERVMTVEELVRFVDASAPEPPSQERGVDRSLRYLLARRLVRNDRGATAMRYMPPEHRNALAEWLKLSRLAERGDATSRAAALTRLARMQRHLGMELSGTELAPDWHVDGGSFDEGASTLDDDPLIGARERERYAASAPARAGRFHYRRVAADTMARAAGLSSGDEAAAMLCAARAWVVARDAKAAASFVRELRRRRLSTAACGGARALELAGPLAP